MIKNISPDGYVSRGAYTPAKKIDFGDFYMIFVSGIQATKANDSNRVLSEDIAEQTHQVFREIDGILKAADASLDDVVKAVIYLTDMNDFDIVSPIRAKYFEKSMPVSTMVEVNGMTRSGAKIEVEVTAILRK